MSSSFDHQLCESDRRTSQPLCNDRCQNILYKAVFEHFIELHHIAVLLLASTSFQNSSFGANFIVNFVVDEDSIVVLESVLSPSSCFSLQFAPSLDIDLSKDDDETVHRTISHFVGELVKTKYLHLCLRSLTLDCVTNEILSFFFGSSSTDTWPQLQNLKLEHCNLKDDVVEVISKNALQLRTVDLTSNSDITDAGVEHLANLSDISSLNLSWCDKITGAGLENFSKLSNFNSLILFKCKSITDVGLEHISNLPAITSVDLGGCNQITDAGLEYLSKLPSIRTMSLSCCGRITDDGLSFVAKLSTITFLNLALCVKITDAGLEHISTLAHIASLNLMRCDKITIGGRQKLKTTLLKCYILE